MPLARSTVLAAGVLACLLGVRAQSQPPERTLVAHDFDTSAHGWLVSGDTGAAEPQFHAAGGHPGGYISYEDEAAGETWYFRAPASVLSALAAAEHGTLSYSLKQSAELPGVLDDDIIILGPAGRLSFRYAFSPGTDWTPFSVKLTAGDRLALELEHTGDPGPDAPRARQPVEPGDPRRIPHRRR